ncbi:MAG: flagellar basal body L-ring protein FlgH [bacterium]|nr:flagellar basal body L-ring protein FlgH [bacterium]
MKLRTLWIILFVLLLLPFTITLKADDFGQNQSLFTDIKAHKVGDILTVNISERNKATNQVANKTEKTSKGSTSGGPGTGTLDFFPMFGAESESKNTFDGKGESVRNNSLSAKISVTVVEVRSNGDLVIEGSRTLGISSDKETIVLTGVVRQKDIAPDNTISSFQIADAQIHYTGKGASNSGSRPGLFTRILTWLF